MPLRPALGGEDGDVLWREEGWEPPLRARVREGVGGPGVYSVVSERTESRRGRKPRVVTAPDGELLPTLQLASGTPTQGPRSRRPRPAFDRGVRTYGVKGRFPRRGGGEEEERLGENKRRRSIDGRKTTRPRDRWAAVQCIVSH